MPLTRRQFLGALVATIGAAAIPDAARAATPATSGAKPQTAKVSSTASSVSQRNEDLLIDSYFPTLAKNEGECLHFYRCARKKVSVGYGTNVQDNPSALTGISVLLNGKGLTPAQLKTFLSTMTDMTKAQLKKYTIAKSDAKKMAINGMRARIQKLSKNMTDDKTKKSTFFELPLCMQALCLDIAYNVGTDKFLKTYPKLQAALKKKDYAGAVKESTVYVDTKKKTTNVSRERRKKRLLRVMDIVQKNASRSVQEICSLVRTDYRSQVPFRVRIIGGNAEIENEQRMALGELAHLRIRQKQLLAQATKPAARPAPKPASKTVLRTASRPVSKPVTRKPLIASVPRVKPNRGPEM